MKSVSEAPTFHGFRQWRQVDLRDEDLAQQAFGGIAFKESLFFGLLAQSIYL